jgi:hypothetical protein
MKKALGVLLVLGSIGGIAYLYYLSGIVEMIQGTKELSLGAPFQELAAEFPYRILILMGSIGAFLYSFKWLMARKAPKLPPVRKSGDPEADRRAEKRRQAAMAANVKIPPRMPGALLMNSYLMVVTAAVLTVGAHSSQPPPTVSLIALVLALQVAVGLILMGMALVWEKSLFRLGGMVGILVHLAMAGALGYTVIRALPTLEQQ